MKNTALTFLVCLVGLVSFAQSETQQRLKYVTNSPDGSIAMIILDDPNETKMQLASATAFYKYQILDTKTSQPIYAAENTGRECTIDKSKVAAGDYNIRLFTSKFVITAKISISARNELSNSMEGESFAYGN